jgi:hypothetical protein
MRNRFVLAALAIALLATPAISSAQEGGDDAEVTKMAKEHYKAGLEAYKNGQYDVAIKELKRAYLLKRLPPLLLNIGATYRKMGDLDLALHFYKKYLDEAPPEAKDRPDVEATIKQIEAEKAGGGSKPAETATPPSETSKEEPPPPKKPMPTEWKHNVVDAAPPGSPLDVRVSMPVMKGVKVYVFYRAAGESDFQQVLMKRHGPEKVGRIPGDAMQGNAMQYYIEARDPQGSVVQSSGSQSSPNIVMIDPSAPPQVVASLDTSRDRGDTNAPEPAEVSPRHDRDEEEAPLLVEGKKHKKERERHASGGGGGGGGSHILRWAGVGMLAGGVALAGAVGGAMFGLAKRQSDAVTADSSQVGRCSDPNGCVSFLYNDPTVHSSGGDDASFEKTGKLYDTLGITFTAIGAGVAVAGVALIIVDSVRGGGSEKPTKPKRRARDEETSWYVAPAFGPNQAGVGGGFSF